MALGTTASVLLGLGALGGTYAATKASSKSASQASAPQALPQAPSASQANTKASENVRRKRLKQSQSVYTNPIGVGGQANIARKTLLGQ